MAKTKGRKRSGKPNHKLGILAILAPAILLLSPIFGISFVNWGDPEYILNNEMVTGFLLSEMFSTLQVAGNYQPLALLSLAVDFRLFGPGAGGLHAVSLLLHLVNGILVYWFVWTLLRKREIALGVGLLFVLHPLHVDTVAWLPARKELLCTAFFLLGLIAYARFIDEGRNRKLYLLCLIWFVLALLSFDMAIAFPLILFAIDKFKGRQWSSQLLLEKAPFLLLGIAAGVLAIVANRAGTSVAPLPEYSMLENMAASGVGILLYAAKSIIPFQLSAYHPFPFGGQQGMPWLFYVAPIVVLGLAILGWRLTKNFPALRFGLLLFVFSILPVLQVMQPGAALILDHAVYLPSLGILIALGSGWDIIRQRKGQSEKSRQAIFVIGGLYLLCLAIASFLRTSAWENSNTLWTDVIEKYPDHYFAFSQRASDWSAQGQPYRAIQDFNACLDRNPQFVEGFNNRGMAYWSAGQFDSAMVNFMTTTVLDPGYYKGHINQGLVLLNQKKNAAALEAFDRAIAINPEYLPAYYNRATVYRRIRRLDDALQDFNTAHVMDPANTKVLIGRAWVFVQKNDLNASLDDVQSALAQDASLGEAYYLRAQIWRRQQLYPEALEDLQLAVRNGFAVPEQEIADMTRISAQ